MSLLIGSDKEQRSYTKEGKKSERRLSTHRSLNSLLAVKFCSFRSTGLCYYKFHSCLTSAYILKIWALTNSSSTPQRATQMLLMDSIPYPFTLNVVRRQRRIWEDNVGSDL